MRRAKLRRWASIGLGGICGVLVALLLAQRYVPRAHATPASESTDRLALSLLQPLKASKHSLPPESFYEAVRRRPLFNADRKPTSVKPKIDPPACNSGCELNAVLTGTIVSAGTRMALVRDRTSAKVVLLKPGMSLPGELMGWRLVSVQARRALFDGGDGRGRAALGLDGSKTAGPAANPLGTTPQGR